MTTPPPGQPPYPPQGEGQPYPPQGGGYYPPQQPPQKKRRVWLWVLLGVLLGIILLFAGCAALLGGAANEIDNQMEENAGKSIRFEISSDSGVAGNITYTVDTGMQQETDATTPWSHEFTSDKGFNIYSLSASNGMDAAGSISCKILVDGEVVAENTSSGDFASVNCNHS